MDKRMKRIGVLVVFGMLVMIAYGPIPTAIGGIIGTDSVEIVMDSDNNSDDEVFHVLHDGRPSDSPPGEELFRIQEDGKVGIGTQDPTQRLDINGSVRIRALPQDDTLNNIVVANTNGVLYIRDVNTIGKDDDWYDVATGISSTDINADIFTYGNVGIGTSLPTQMLDVNGGVRVRDLPQDDTLDDIVVTDSNGVMHTRDADTIGFSFNIVTATDDYTPISSDYTIIVDASSNDVTVTLPPAADAFAQVLVLKRIDDDKKTKVTIDADGSEMIDGDLSINLKTKYMSYTIQSDGSGWYILASYGFMGNSHINNENR